MWCIVSSSTCSSLAQPQQRRPAAAAPRARSNGRRASSAASRRDRRLALRLAAAPTGPPPAGANRRRARSPAPARRPPRANVVRSASCRRTISLERAAPAPPRPARPRSRSASGHVVGGAPRLQLVQEPQPLLRERQRQRAPCARPAPPAAAPAAPRGASPPRARPAPPPSAPRTAPAAAAPRRSTCAHPRHHLRRQQRVPAQLEEVVVHAHPLHAQHLRPDPRQRLLRRACAAPRSRRAAHAPPSGAGSALRSTLPFGVSGSASSTHERRRHHVLRQPRPQVLAQLAASGASPSPHHVRHQPLVARRVLARHHHRLAHRRVLRAARASISPSSMRKPRIFTCWSMRPRYSSSPSAQPPRQVARPVQPRARLAPNGSRHEPLRRQLRPAQVAARHARAADVQLARHAHRHRLAAPVQHVERAGPGSARRSGCPPPRPRRSRRSGR